ncbi:MAG: hypothetical protein GX075_11605 [Firmicutes bacterium]|nr:hypothetical protein [Bacillota bacterium]
MSGKSGEGQFNSRLRIDNTSGHKGVTLHKRRCKWEASIKIDGVKKYLGAFTNIEEAIKARQLAEIKYFGWSNSIQQPLPFIFNQSSIA